MTQAMARHVPSNRTGLDRAGIARFAQVIVFQAILSGVLFAAAGRLDWRAGWAYTILYLTCVLTMGTIVARRHPEIVNARGRQHDDNEGWDRVLTTLFIPLMLISMSVAGLDAGRYGWSSVPPSLTIASAVVFVLSNALIYWAMAANTHFETRVRIQTDRAHQVASSGPYRIMRHPGYVGFIVASFSATLVLGSLWSLAPAALSCGLMVYRTAREDRTLRDKLPGYADYSRQTRFRLLPGVW